jgi:hypothetical protein
VLVVVMLLFGVTILPAASYSTADVDRGASLGVADDPDAALGLVIAENVSVGTHEELVVVTNRLGGDVTATVALDDSSTSKGTLSVASGETGDSVSFTLAEGASQQVDVDVANDSALAGDTLVFHVSANGTGIDAAVNDRQTAITE